MLRLPDGLTYPKLGAILVALVAGVWALGEAKERTQMLDALELYAKNTPAHAVLARTVADCHRKLIVDSPGCSVMLVERFGPQVLDDLMVMFEEGAFGEVSPP